MIMMLARLNLLAENMLLDGLLDERGSGWCS